MNKVTLKALLEKSLAQKITFPEILSILLKNGFESYQVDFMRNEIRSYSTNGESVVANIDFIHEEVSQHFSAENLENINHRVQAGKATFIDFVKESTAAGCANYVVYLYGKKARYFGRHGDEYIQHFPSNLIPNDIQLKEKIHE